MDSLSRRSFLAAALASGVVAACGSGSEDASASSSTSSSTSSPSSTSTTPSTTSTSSTSTAANDPGSSADPGQVETVGHTYQRAEAVAAPAIVAGVVAADRKLATDLFTLLSEQESGNFLFSPYSIATAFSMAEAGAESETEAQMRAALGIDMSDPDWHAGRNALDQTIRTPTPGPEGAAPLELELSNAFFGQAGFGFVEEFIRVLAEQYGADLNTVDFVSDPEAVRLLINRWIADKTADRITDLLPSGSIDDLVRLVLVNTVFFTAEWVTQFDPDQTAPAAFTLLDGSTTEVQMMQAQPRTTYGQGDGWQMVRLRYWGGYSMTVVLPDTGRFEDVAQRLSGGLLDEISALVSDHLVTLSLPKFDFSTPSNLIPLFQSLGMVDPFDPTRADFSGMATDAELFISGAFHQATIDVDEFGTTATAATAIVGSVTSMPQPAEFTADRPFLFVIEHDETGEPLFIGRVMNPGQ